MYNKVVKEADEKMSKTIDATKDKLAAIRAGRANINMLDAVMVAAYGGAPQPLKQVAGLSAPEPRVLLIDPWDKSVIRDIEKGIQQSNLGLTPSNDGKTIRIQIPEMTEERRKEYLKIAKKETEEGKVALRNIRKDMNNKLRKLQKDSEITEDQLKNAENKIQDMTDKYVKKVDDLYTVKEKDIKTI